MWLKRGGCGEGETWLRRGCGEGEGNVAEKEAVVDERGMWLKRSCGGGEGNVAEHRL